MKKILLTVLAAVTMLIFVPLANADMFVLYNDNKTGDGLPVNLYQLKPGEFRTWSCDIEVSDNSTTAVTVAINGNQCTQAQCRPSSLNKFSPIAIALYNMNSTELAAGFASFRIVDTPVQRIRASLVTLMGGTNPNITVRCTGVR
ncbi:MAG: hypothetical protein L7F77_08065 [Candidatus Magnetominusculus sp. LBB02]|nr:hypothetical protein [Candidatus Magnetominusculus sp. LBB02]